MKASDAIADILEIATPSTHSRVEIDHDQNVIACRKRPYSRYQKPEPSKASRLHWGDSRDGTPKTLCGLDIDGALPTDTSATGEKVTCLTCKRVAEERAVASTMARIRANYDRKHGR